jgi:iron complex transport system permease protein
MEFFKKQWKRIATVLLFIVLVFFSLEIGALSGAGIRSLFTGAEMNALELEIARLNAIPTEGLDNAELLALIQEQRETNERFNQLYSQRAVMLHSRLPRLFAVILSAAGLSVAGLLMQAISRNKFMSPSTAGTTDAAALGMLMGVVFFGDLPALAQGGMAFVFALVATMIFTSVISKLKLREVVYIPLIGILYGGLISAVATAIGFRTALTPILMAFNMGSFARLGNFTLVYVVLIPLFISVMFVTKFSIIGLGEDFAKNLGVNYKRVVFLGLVIVALISASTFVAVGPLPFVGLIIPNMATSFYGDNLKKSIWDLMLFGATFVMLCDIISRLVLFPFEMNVTVTVSVVGGIVFMIYLIRGMNSGKRIRAKA